MKCCTIRINTILNFVYFNVLGQVEDLKKDTESIKEDVNDIKGDLKEGIEIIKGYQKNIKQFEESMKGIEERMEMFIQGNEYNAGKGKENIAKRKLSNH